MENDYIFLFDLDSTITKEEILPKIASKNNKVEQMKKLTEQTMMGNILFEESFRARVDMLKDISVNEVAKIVSEISLSEKLVTFLNENKERCYIVTSNLDVWIEKLMTKIGMDGHYFSSKAQVENDKILKIEKIITKESVIKMFDKKIVAVGDGSNDRVLLDCADIGIGYGGVRNIAPCLMEVINYAIYDESKLYNFLNRLV